MSPVSFKCPGCGEALRLHSYFSGDEKRLKRCDSCFLVFVYPRMRDAELLSQYTEGYFEKKYKKAVETHYTNSKVWTAKLEKCLQRSEELCISYTHNQKKLLDVGCGTGRFLEVGLSKGWDVAGIELCKSVARETAERLGVEVLPGSLFDHQIPNKHYDLITMFDVIEHLEDPAIALDCCFRALKPGGVVTLSTPNFQGFGRKLMGSQAFAIWPDEHILYFSPRSLRGALSRAGFVGIETTTRDIYPENAAAIVRKVLDLFRRNMMNQAEEIVAVKNVVRGSSLLRNSRTVFNGLASFIPLGDELVGYARKPLTSPGAGN